MVCAIGALPGGVGGMRACAASLRPIDRATLQPTVDTAAKKLMVPGALVLLRTPRGEFVVSCGTTQLGGAISLEPHIFGLLRQS
jgi:hypothetical protein